MREQKYLYLTIDYESVLDHLLHVHNYDSPLGLSFEVARNALADQAEAMLRGGIDDPQDNVVEDGTLSEILMFDYRVGIVHDITVTSGPGIRVVRDGQAYLLPLVIIELRFNI